LLLKTVLEQSKITCMTWVKYIDHVLAELDNTALHTGQVHGSSTHSTVHRSSTRVKNLQSLTTLHCTRVKYMGQEPAELDNAPLHTGQVPAELDNTALHTGQVHGSSTHSTAHGSSTRVKYTLHCTRVKYTGQEPAELDNAPLHTGQVRGSSTCRA